MFRQSVYTPISEQQGIPMTATDFGIGVWLACQTDIGVYTEHTLS